MARIALRRVGGVGLVAGLMLALAGCASPGMQSPGGSQGSAAGIPGSSSSGSAAGSSGSSGGTSSASSGSKSAEGKSAGASAGSAGGLPGGTSAETSATSGGMPGSKGATGAGAGSGSGSGDPEAVFDKSLGDFDGEMSKERAAMASTGKGSARGAQQRESGDAGAVKTSGAGRSGRGADAGDGGDAAGTDSGDSKAGQESGAAAAGGAKGSDAGPGQNQVKNESAGAPAEAGRNESTKVQLPADIPADGSGEDQVARQIREAALAEKDARIRDALWDEYRRQMGIKKK